MEKHRNVKGSGVRGEGTREGGNSGCSMGPVVFKAEETATPDHNELPTSCS